MPIKELLVFHYKHTYLRSYGFLYFNSKTLTVIGYYLNLRCQKREGPFDILNSAVIIFKGCCGNKIHNLALNVLNIYYYLVSLVSTSFSF